MGDKRGNLISLEENINIPFDIKRIYYIYDTDINTKRGMHAHINIKQMMICVKGSCKFRLDDGKDRVEILLNSPSKGLLIEGLIWREMFDFSDDCVLVVLANTYYKEESYIRDYDEFLKISKENQKISE